MQKFSNQIQECIKITVYYDQVRFIPDMTGWFDIQKSVNVIICINKLKKNHSININRCRENTRQNPTPNHDKNSQSFRKLDPFPQWWGQWQGCPFSPLSPLFNIIEVLASAINKKRKYKINWFERKKLSCIFFAVDMMVYDMTSTIWEKPQNWWKKSKNYINEK